jgi:predicted aminopeptidase
MTSAAIPVEEALDKRSLGPREKGHIQLVAQVKTFAVRELGLKETNNYETVYIESNRFPLYTLSASPKDRLDRVTWWFPIVGRVPYLGFFSLDKAQEKGKKLIEKDLDIFIGAADAYSTLGWFQDPLTLNLITGHTVPLVETIIHEMTHTTLYVKGQTEFNEGLAQIIGKVGAYQFFKSQYGPHHQNTLEAYHAIEDERVFARYLADLFDLLSKAYNASRPYEQKLQERDKIFSHFRERYKIVKTGLKTPQFKGFDRVPLNNAYLLAVGLYHRHFAVFEAVLRSQGYAIPDMLFYFENLAAQEKDILKSVQARFKHL